MPGFYFLSHSVFVPLSKTHRRSFLPTSVSVAFVSLKIFSYFVCSLFLKGWRRLWVVLLFIYLRRVGIDCIHRRGGGVSGDGRFSGSELGGQVGLFPTVMIPLISGTKIPHIDRPFLFIRSALLFFCSSCFLSGMFEQGLWCFSSLLWVMSPSYLFKIETFFTATVSQSHLCTAPRYL